jgi:hypothetical protein
MLEASPPYDGLLKRAAYIACLIKGINSPNKICGYVVQLTFGLNIDLGNDVKGPSTELFDHGAVWFAININPDGYIKCKGHRLHDGLMANMTSLFEDWGDANTADRFLNIYFYELNTKQLLQLIFPLSKIANTVNVKFYGTVLVGIQNTVPKFLSPLATTF